MLATTTAEIAAVAAALSALASVVGVALLGRRIRQLREVVDELRAETVPLVREARVVAGRAATEMERVGDVLGSAEAVSAAVDSASRLAYRAFANPVVKVLAFGSGLGGALRRLLGRSARPDGGAPARAVPGGRPARNTSTPRPARRRRRAGHAARTEAQ